MPSQISDIQLTTPVEKADAKRGEHLTLKLGAEAVGGVGSDNRDWADAKKNGAACISKQFPELQLTDDCKIKPVPQDSKDKDCDYQKVQKKETVDDKDKNVVKDQVGSISKGAGDLNAVGKSLGNVGGSASDSNSWRETVPMRKDMQKAHDADKAEAKDEAMQLQNKLVDIIKDKGEKNK